MVFAKGVERDPLNNDKVASGGTRGLFKDGAENLVRVAGVSACKFKNGAGDTARSIDESVARWVLTNGTQDGARGIGNGRLGPWGRRDRNGWSALGSHGHILPAPPRSYGRA